MSVAHAPQTQVRRPHINPWLVALLVLSAGLVALGTWTIVDRSTESEPAATQIVDDLNAAVNAGDAEAVRALFTPDAVFQVSTGDRISGLESVVDTVLIPHGIGLRIERAAPVTVEGDSAATFISYGSGAEGAQGIELAVFRLKDGKIVRMWVYDEGYR